MVIAKYDSKTGLYLVAESIDFGGKGTIINTIKNSCVDKNFIDLRLLWPSDEPDKIPAAKGNTLFDKYGTDDVIPKYEDLKQEFMKQGRSLNTIFTCEPTWAKTGLKIRKKAIHETLGRKYTARETAELYAEDRQKLISKLIRPAILDGVDVFCERNFCSSIVYQSSMDNPLTVEEITSLESNKYAMRNAPHLYIICDVSADTAIKRKAGREKDDHCKFEVPEFLTRIEDRYRSEELKKMLNSHGSKVVYVNTDKPTTPEDTARAAIDILNLFRLGELKDGQRINY
ncbi:hypothetical protein HQ545_08580 [Candidatus Woesearchaeota archaeon]|nr:hypothetical protein [Candidatus Woesearchaeota archaeon]